MVSEVLVSFGGDSSKIRSESLLAQQAINQSTVSMQQSLDAANPAFVKLQESIDQLNESARESAEATSALKSYADWATIFTVVSISANVVTTSVGYTYQGIKLLGEGAIAAAVGVGNLSAQFLNYARSQSYMSQYLPLVKVENEGLIASLGRGLKVWDDYGTRADIARKGLADITAVTVVAAGNMDRFTQSLRESLGSRGLDATDGIREMLFQLTESKKISSEAAVSIVGMFGSIPGISGPMIQSLVNITSQMSSTSEQALVLGEQLSKALSDPANSGESFLKSQKDITAEMLSQFDAAKRNQNISEMQSIILQELSNKERALFEEKSRKLQENIKSAGALAFIFKDEVDAHNKAVAAMQKQLDTTEQLTNKIKSLPQDMNQTAIAAQNIVSSLNPLSYQIEKISANIKTMTSAFGDMSSKTSNYSSNGISNLLKKEEGFRSESYWDGNTKTKGGAWRVGYGSDTKTSSDGSISKVDQNTIVTKEEAELDLARRIVEFQKQAADQIGPAWSSVSNRAKDAITSVVYNYGANSSALKGMYSAARTGDDSLIANSIRKLDSNPARRKAEADYIDKPNPQQESLNKEKDALEAANAARRGGTAVALAQAEIIERTARGEKDSVADAELLVEAWKKDLSTSNQRTTQLSAQNGLNQAQYTLAQKILEVKKSQLLYDSTGDETAEDKRNSAKKTLDIELEAAGNDVAAKNAAKTKMIQAQLTYDAEIIKMSQQTENTKYAIELAGIETRKSKINEDLLTHKISNTQKLRLDLELADEQTALTKSHLETLKNLEIEGTLGYKQVQDKLTLLTSESITRRQQIITQDSKKIQQSYEQAFNTIGSSVTSSLMGIIQRTQNFKGLMQNVATSIVGMFVKMGVDSVARWAAAQAQMLIQTVTGQAAQTAAVATGTAAQTAAKATGAAAGVAITKTAASAEITTDAAKAGAGAYSAIVGIPIIGPILAPVAAATAFAATSAFGSFDVGSWSVPNDQLAMVHAGEMIVPTRGGVAEEFRNKLSGDSSNSPNVNVNFNVSAMDGSSVKSFFSNNSKHILGALDDAVKNGSHLGFRRLGG